jgi:STIM1 Orai1-activating region
MSSLNLKLKYLQCEKLKKKRSSLVGAFVSTHGKSIDDVDRSIVEARYVQAFVQVCSSFSVLQNGALSFDGRVVATRAAAPCTSLSKTIIIQV